MQQTRGKLRLHFTRDSEHQRTQLLVREQCPPLQVIRAFPLSSGGALVHIHNISGGVLGGDQLALDVEVGPGAHAQLTSTSATRLYRSRPETPTATQTGMIRVREDALLEYLPDPLIPFSGSRYQQSVRIDLEAGAGLFWWETVAPGRIARKELGALAQELSRPGELSWGVSTLVAHGMVIRALSRQGRDILPGLLSFWRAAKRNLYNEEAAPPRKIY